MTSTPIMMPSGSSGGRFVLPLVGLSLAALYLVTRHPMAPDLVRAVAGILGLGFLPGLALTLWVERRFGVWSSWVLPLALSPALVSMTGLAAGRLGYAPEALTSWIVLVSAVAVTFAPASGRELEDRELSLDVPGFLRARSDRTQVIVLASAVLALVSLPLLLHEWLYAWGPPLFHQGVIREMGFGLPPNDPLLAGVSFRGSWAFDLYLSMLGETAGVGTDVLLAGGSVIALFCLVFAAYELLRGLRLSHAESLWGTLFLFLSLGGLCWLLDPAIRKATAAAGVWDAAGLWERYAQLTGPGSDRLAVGFPTTAAMFLEPFLVPSPLGWALLYAVLFAAGVLRALDRGGLRPWVLTVVAAGGLVLLHPTVAALMLGTSAVLAPVMWLVAAEPPWRRRGARFLGLWGAAALAVALSLPYLRAISAHGGFMSQVTFGMEPLRTAVLFLLLAPQLLLALTLWLVFLRGEDLPRLTWAVWGLLVFLAAEFVGFGGDRPLLPSLLLVHVFLALTAGAMVPRVWRGSPRWLKPVVGLILIVLLVPRTAVGIRAYLVATDPRDSRPEYTEAVAWIAKHTPADAVIVDYLPWLSLSAGRAGLLGSRDHLRAQAYSDKGIIVRALAANALIIGQLPEEGTVFNSLRELGRPLFIVRRLPTRVPPPPGSERVYTNPGFDIYRWTIPDPAPGPPDAAP